MTTCPGQDHRKLTICDVTCPGCGRQVEMFSDELRVRCPYCKTMIYKEQMPSCIQWCQAARECVGPERYEELVGAKLTKTEEHNQSQTPKRTGQLKVIEILNEEHRLILRALEIAREENESLRNSENYDSKRLEKLLAFFRDFADRFHHAKEEDLLFKKMEIRGMPVEGGPIGIMLSEHQTFRGYVSKIAKAFDLVHQQNENWRNVISENLAAYIEGLTSHIEKEEKILYPMANGILTESDKLKLQQEFSRVGELFGNDFFERQRQLLLELSRR